MHDEAIAGRKFKGLKLVEGRANRVWKDKDKVVESLTDNLYSKNQILISKLAGIGVIEKLLGKKEFTEVLGDLVIKPASKASLVPDTDKRPAMGLASAQRDFAED